MDSERFIDYYKVLGVDRLASTETIKEKCLELGKRLRPRNDPMNLPRNEQNFALIEQAFATLCDPQSRDAYDLVYNDHYIKELSDSSGLRFPEFKPGWWKQPWVIATSILMSAAAALGVYSYLDYLEAREAETTRWIQRARDSAVELQRKQEEWRDRLKEAEREGERRAAERRHRELLNEQQKAREELENLRKEVEYQDLQRKLRESRPR